jgi:hypothetical protein
MAGDYGHFAKYLEPGALEFLARLAVAPGTRMLDVACGAGQIALPAARAGARVTGVDIASNLIEQARARAEAEGHRGPVRRGRRGDAPLRGRGLRSGGEPDRGDVRAPARVGGRRARARVPARRPHRLANWTPEGHVGHMFKIIGKHVPPPPLMPSPLKWGEEATVCERLREGVAELNTTKRLYPMRYPFGPAEVVEFFRVYYGPTNRAFAALDAAGQGALRQDLEQLWAGNNRARDGSTHVESEYLEVTATRG